MDELDNSPDQLSQSIQTGQKEGVYLFYFLSNCNKQLEVILQYLRARKPVSFSLFSPSLNLLRTKHNVSNFFSFSKWRGRNLVYWIVYVK